jgi:hypothetical protein
MNCPKCTTENDQSTKFCKNCGTNLQPKPVVEASANSNLSDIFLIIYLGLTIIVAFGEFAIKQLDPIWYLSSARYLLGFLWIIHNASAILLPLSIKNKLMKLLGIIFTSILIIYWIYGHIKWLLEN